MKKELGFWRSLEEYTWKVVARSPLPWQWVGVGAILIALAVSIKSAKYSTVGAKDLREAVEIATRVGDYETAQWLWDEDMSGLEDKVFPERKVENGIAELEQKLAEYPGNREIFTSLASLYDQLGATDKASEYREKARVLDPNGMKFE